MVKSHTQLGEEIFELKKDHIILIIMRDFVTSWREILVILTLETNNPSRQIMPLSSLVNTGRGSHNFL